MVGIFAWCIFLWIRGCYKNKNHKKIFHYYGTSIIIIADTHGCQ